jgi:exodeoxyribonuclease VII large subunit
VTLLQSEQSSLDQVKARLNRESPIRRVERERQAVDTLSSRVERGVLHGLSLYKARLQNVSGRLIALNPKAVLQRGYALVRLEDGTIIRSADQLKIDTKTSTLFAHGSAVSRVESTKLD